MFFRNDKNSLCIFGAFEKIVFPGFGDHCDGGLYAQER